MPEPQLLREFNSSGIMRAVVADGGSELKPKGTVFEYSLMVPQLEALVCSCSGPCIGQCVIERSFSFNAHSVCHMGILF